MVPAYAYFAYNLRPFFSSNNAFQIVSPSSLKSIPISFRFASLPDLEDFQFEGTPINQTLVNDLAGGGFIAQQRNAVLTSMRWRRQGVANAAERNLVTHGCLPLTPATTAQRHNFTNNAPAKRILLLEPGGCGVISLRKGGRSRIRKWRIRRRFRAIRQRAPRLARQCP